MYRHPVILILILAICFTGGASASNAASRFSQSFLYIGLTDEQWQVFRYDFATKQSKQLTFSTGDKRRPQYHAATDSIYFKDSQGWIIRLSSDGSETRISDKGRIAEFCMIPTANVLLYTCLMANNPQRQALWRLDLQANEASPQLLKRMPTGSIRQIAVKSEREVIVSHIAKRREERLFVLDDSGQERYITPQKTVSIYPTWDSINDRVLHAKELKDGSYDLYALNFASGEINPLLETENASEFATSVSPDGNTVLIEQHVYGLPPRIVYYNQAASKLAPIQLEHPAKEPFWYL